MVKHFRDMQLPATLCKVCGRTTAATRGLSPNPSMSAKSGQNPSNIHRKIEKIIKNHQKSIFSKSFLIVSLHVLEYSPGRPEAWDASGRPGEYARRCRETTRKDFEKLIFWWFFRFFRWIFEGFLMISIELCMIFSPLQRAPWTSLGASQASGRPGEFSWTCREIIRKDFQKIEFDGFLMDFGLIFLTWMGWVMVLSWQPWGGHTPCTVPLEVAYLESA